MKRSILICSALTALACSGQDEAAGPVPVRLHVSTTRAVDYSAEDYFGLEGLANASVEARGRTVAYTFRDGTLAGAAEGDILYFPVDGSPLATLAVRWPEDAVRKEQGDLPPKDQRERSVFLAADRLAARLTEVAPTQEVVLTLRHERPKVSFRIAGDQAGRKITSLSVGGYDAYCDADPEVTEAQLVLLPGESGIEPGSIGTLTLAEGDGPRNFIIRSMPALTAGSNHTVEINL